MEKPYHYVLFRWWVQLDLEKVQKELSTRFTIKVLHRPTYVGGMEIRKDERNEIEVESDSLKAQLSPFRVILFQENKVPFTRKDVELRERIKEIYPRDRPTPFQWKYIDEPKTKYQG